MNPLIDLALLLFGAKLGGIMFAKIKQPSVAGEIIAGIILGPSLLALVKPSGLVSAVSDLGLLFLILLVSMSIDWRMLEGKTEKYAWMELARAMTTLLLVYLVASVFSWSIYTFLIIGFVMVLSSTAIVSRTLADIKELGSQEGHDLMGLEVVDEIAAIISVAVLANIMSGEALAFEPLVTTILVVIGFFVVMGRVGFRLVNKLTNSIQKYGIEEALLGFTLLLAFILGGITESLNLASLLGVFIAGMILSKSSQFPIITRKVKEIGESFFIPIFFASVGLAINILAAFEQPALIIGLILLIVLIKIISSLTVLKLFHYPTEQSLKISSGFVTLSEMTIVIVALAASRLSPVICTGIIASFIIINAVSPLIMNLAFRNRMNPGPKLYARKNGWVSYPNKKTYSYSI